jgi:hypothetical protein
MVTLLFSAARPRSTVALGWEPVLVSIAVFHLASLGAARSTSL